MKDIGKIEKMSLEELEAEAMKAAGAEDFAGRAGAEDLVGSLARAEALLTDEGRTIDLRKRLIRSVTGIAAGIAIIAGIGLALRHNTPKDTFSDPMLAYAQVEMAFNKIGEGLKKGSDAVEKSSEMMQKPIDIMNNTLEK